jgi:transposase
MDLTDAQWEILRGVFVQPRRADGKGRPPRDARAVLNGVLWILHTGAPWKDLPDRYLKGSEAADEQVQEKVNNGVLAALA